MIAVSDSAVISCFLHAQDSVWSVRDQPAEHLSEQRSRNTQDSELSLSLLCYTEAQESVCDSHGSVDQNSTESLESDCNAGEQLPTPMKTCSVKLLDCRNIKETREEATAEKVQSDDDNDDDDDDDEDFNPSGMFLPLIYHPNWCINKWFYISHLKLKVVGAHAFWLTYNVTCKDIT